MEPNHNKDNFCCCDVMEIKRARKDGSPHVTSEQRFASHGKREGQSAPGRGNQKSPVSS